MVRQSEAWKYLHSNDNKHLTFNQKSSSNGSSRSCSTPVLDFLSSIWTVVYVWSVFVMLRSKIYRKSRFDYSAITPSTPLSQATRLTNLPVIWLVARLKPDVLSQHPVSLPKIDFPHSCYPIRKRQKRQKSAFTYLDNHFPAKSDFTIKRSEKWV